MKRLLLTLCLLISTVGVSAQDFSKERSYVHQIQIQTASGSGVSIADGYLITSAHVVLAIPKGSIVIDNYARARVVKIDPFGDLALLYAPDIHCPCAPLADGIPSIDEELVGVGYPLYQLVEVQLATEGRFQGLNKNEQMVTTVDITFGNSGGGMFTKKDSKLVAIVNSIIGIPQGPPNFNISDMHHYIAIGVSVLKVRSFIKLPTGQPTVNGLSSLGPEKTMTN